MPCSLEDLYNCHREKLTAFVASRIHDRESAKDLVHDVFLRVAAYCDRGGRCSSPKSLLYKVTTNLIVDHYRMKNRKAMDTLPQMVLFDEGSEDFLDCLAPLIERLPAIYRDAVRLADIEQLPQQEIARRMGVSLSGVKSRIQRGRLKLKDTILRLCHIHRERCGTIACSPPRP